MLASFCTRFGDVKDFIFCIRAGGRLTSGAVLLQITLRSLPIALLLKFLLNLVKLCLVLLHFPLRIRHQLYVICSYLQYNKSSKRRIHRTIT